MPESQNQTKKLPTWIKLFPIVTLTYILFVEYNILYRGGLSLAVWSESLAATGGIFIGLSFVLSSVSYFFDFADKYLRYRKELGLYGYFLALIYSFSLQYRFPDKYFFGLINSLRDWEVILGLLATGILTMMALISTKTGMKVLGPVLWRRLLRTGYIAYLLLIIRAVIVEYDIWTTWLNSPDILIPPRLVLSIYATFIILARIGMEISIRSKKKS